MFVEYIESLPLANTPDVFGLHPNAEIGYYTTAVKDMWTHLIDLQPQTAGDAGGISREDFIAKIASDIQGKLPALFDVELIRKNYTEIQPTTVVLLQELDRFNVLIRKMSTSLVTLQRVRNHRDYLISRWSKLYVLQRDPAKAIPWLFYCRRLFISFEKPDQF